MCWEASDYGAGASRTNQEYQDKTIMSGLENINKAFEGYDNNFYNQYKQSYIDYYLPQIASQYQTAQKNTAYDLANRGLTDSGAAQTQYADLAKQLGVAEQQLADNATAQSQSLQSTIAQQKATLTNQLLTSVYPTTVANQALTTASQFEYPSTWAPIANQFSSDTDAASNVLQNNDSDYSWLYS